MAGFGSDERSLPWDCIVSGASVTVGETGAWMYCGAVGVRCSQALTQSQTPAVDDKRECMVCMGLFDS